MLTVSQLFQKLENREDCKKCEQVAKMNDTAEGGVGDQLLDRLPVQGQQK